jgi:predicted ATPase/class 3 adenylate cyclase
MSELPTGTVTFLFTDIAGSTQLLQQLGANQYRDALESQRRLVREAVARHDGHEVDTQGDAFFVAFTRAQDAVGAAGEAQRSLAAHAWPDDRALRVRMGIHTCEATVTGEGYVGVGVHRGARICAAGHGGQVLLSHTTYDLIEEEDVGFDVQDLGEHRLKHLTEPHRLFQLVDRAIPHDFPPLNTLDNRPTNLPIQSKPMVGREHEIGEVAGLLRREDVRLVTLTGPGGTGKTRLSLQAAAERIEEFPHGVYFVALATITRPDFVLSTVAQTLAVNVTAGQSLSDYMATKKLLLVIDNFEHVIAAAPQLADLLAAAADLKLLVTSREPLRLAAEHVYPVPGLKLPNTRRLPELAALSQYEAVALFVERAQAVQPSFEVTTANAPAVAEICVRLDGLPLALELAAARIPLLSPEALLSRLRDRLKTLRGGARDAPTRHQTLRGTLEWSYDLLAEEERQLLAWLGVFRGGFTVESAEAVCDAQLEALGSLVDKNLVRRDGERLTMLETTHEFALEKLAESEDVEQIRQRHAEHMISLAESANLTAEAEGEQRHDIVIREQGNVRGALEWALESGEVECGLRLAITLEGYWVASSPLEGRRWLDDLLARTKDLPGDLRARALRAMGGACYIFGEYEEGARHFEASLREFRRLGGERGIADLLGRLAIEAVRRRETERARVLQDEALVLDRKINSKRGESRAAYVFAMIELQRGNDALALQLFEQSAALAGECGFTWWRLGRLLDLAELLLDRGRIPEADRRLREALPLAVQIGDRQATIFGLALLARSLGDAGLSERAGLLWGAIEAEEARAPVGGWETERDHHERLVLTHAGPEFERGRQEGNGLSLDEAADRVQDVAV